MGRAVQGHWPKHKIWPTIFSTCMIGLISTHVTTDHRMVASDLPSHGNCRASAWLQLPSFVRLSLFLPSRLTYVNHGNCAIRFQSRRRSVHLEGAFRSESQRQHQLSCRIGPNPTRHKTTKAIIARANGWLLVHALWAVRI